MIVSELTFLLAAGIRYNNSNRVGFPAILRPGIPMSDTIEERLSRVEKELAELKHAAQTPRDKSNWITKISGTFEGDADFKEIVRLGKEIRDAERFEEIE